jgi:putative ABC transport system permease protein
VAWAVPMLRSLPTVRAADGTFRACILQGLDDGTLVGAPRAMLLGKAEDLRKPDAVILDRAGFESYFPGQPLRLGDVLEINDRRAVIVGICEARAPFQTFPVLFSRLSLARECAGPRRNQVSFVLVGVSPGHDRQAVAAAISRQTDLHATTTLGFAWQTVFYYMTHTGIPINFGITIIVAIIVGTVVAGQTFYIFTIENLKQFAALKAIGVGNGQLVGMVLTQALTVAVAGIGLGLGTCSAFFEVTLARTPTRGLVLLPEVGLGTFCLLMVVVLFASLLSLRKVLRLEPAVVFRG